MGYDIEGLRNYGSRYIKTRKALDYLWVANWCHDGDKDKIIEMCKANLSSLKTEFEISAMIEAIKITKRNLKVKIGIKSE